MGFKDGVFDYVLFSYNGIDCISPENERLRALKEINRCLKRGVFFIFSSLNSWFIINGSPLNPSSYFRSTKIRLHQIAAGKIFSKYKNVNLGYGVAGLHFINPFEQKNSLRTVVLSWWKSEEGYLVAN